MTDSTASASTLPVCRPTSGAVPLVQSVARAVGVAAAASHYSVSDEGTLVYIVKSTSTRSLVWVNRDGAAGSTVATIPPGTHEEPRLSPDDRRGTLGHALG